MTRILVGLILIVFSCSERGDGSVNQPLPQPENIIPSNLILTINIAGADTNNPNGDGTGVIQCMASAANAVKYGFKFGSDPVQESVSGAINHTYTTPGINNYLVTVFAYSSTGNTISTFKNISIKVSTSEPQATWFDEFDVDGAPDSSKWNYDIGVGNGANEPGAGWGNNEVQYYTNRTDNVKVENGLLIITVKKENYQGSHYTSARLKTKGKYEFTYGKVEIRAKLAGGGGTWPAFWTLGANIDQVPWPACGEIDIMEHVGNNSGTVQSALHTPSSFGNTQNKGAQMITNATSEFHIYTLEWTTEKMIFSVDGSVHYTYQPAVRDSSTWPFNANQFILINIAMGGTLGGTIDSGFTEETMEIDYVRVYQ
jgi:beta-glucanase (GH16 family)